MHNLLEQLHRLPTPLVVQSKKTAILKAVKAVHLEILRLSVGSNERADVTSNVASLRRYALWLEDVAIEYLSEPGEHDIEELESLFSAASTLYEFVGTLTTSEEYTSIFRAPLNDLLRSAIVSSFTQYQSHSSLIGRRLWFLLERHTIDVPDIKCHIMVAKTLAALVARNFNQAVNLSKQLDILQSPALEHLKSNKATNKEFLDLDRSLAIGRVCGKVAIGMRTGIMALLSQATERLEYIKERAAATEDANHYWLADRLSQLVNHMRDASMHRILSEYNLPYQYRDMLTREGFLEFWGPQRQAIEYGLLNSSDLNHYVVSIPTGAGKTLFAELLLLSALNGDNRGWAVYVAPTRALVSQVSRDLRHRLGACNITIRTIVAGAEQGLLFDEELNLLEMDYSVTVTTPEKLDAYYRNAPELFDSCRVVIFDEVHKVGEGSRGLLLESLIARFLSRQPKTRLLLLSGVMSNVDEFKSWLGSTGTITIKERNRPTRRVYGVAVRTEEMFGATKQANVKGIEYQRRRVDFKGALILVHEREDLEQNSVFILPNVFDGYYSQRYFPNMPLARQWQEERGAPHTSVNDHAIKLAEALVSTPGTVLVFMQLIPGVQRACEMFKGQIPTSANLTNNRERLSSFIAVELGEDHPLVHFCRQGIAYHHARLPHSVQRALEMALERGWLKVVFATPTLREGLNTPATTVIIAGHLVYNEIAKQNVDISESDFMNLAGRAGRPGVDTEGRVFLIPNSLSTAISSGRKYILANDNVLRVRSQLKHLADLLTQTPSDTTLTSLAPNYQAFLLGLEAAGLAGEEDVDLFINSTLWFVQEQDEERTFNVGRRINATLTEAKASIGIENVALASRLGFSLSSSETLRVTLLKHRAVFLKETTIDNKQEVQIQVLLDASMSLPEIRKGIKGKTDSSHIYLKSLLAWIRGDRYQQIQTIAFETEVITKDDITEVVKYATDISTWLSWAFGAAYTILDHYLAESIDPYVGILPLLIKYGVPTAATAYISLLGVSDRSSALILGQLYESEHSSENITLDAVTKWIDSIEPDLPKILGSSKDGLRAELVTQQVKRTRTVEPLHQKVEIRAKSYIEEGAILSCHLVGNTVFILDNEKVVGESIDNARWAQFQASELGSLTIVAVQNIAQDTNGPVFVIN